MISIILPTYKEAENLRVLLPQIHQVLQSERHEIIVVDDNSKDGSEELCKQLARELPLRFIKRRTERGLATAVLAGFDQAKGDYLFCMDADLSHPPEVLLKLHHELKKGVQFALASRYISGASIQEGWGFLRHINSLLPTYLTKSLTSIKDPMSGFFGLPRETYLKQRSSYKPLGYKIALELIVKLQIKVIEIPFTFQHRFKGSSKLNMKQRLLFLIHLSQLYRHHLNLKPSNKLHFSKAHPHK
ncbi:polyprenol monophosphomannose synthase [Lentisphaera profundi]|uniref:Polyprenol monophosphomannose synthase n=1 Tax=Lentisphaera profundi TaxID=1658616 RepID=A0ABY7VWI5_9BACT|nr:polyprenol monophosphomannose synthase [Lentisphaera profundi]WDE98600.1 polyprenol monophosphomannose synthase [Lentisphaera profundi]